MTHHPPPPPLSAPEPVPPSGEVRAGDVWRGFGRGALVSWGTRLPLVGLAFLLGGGAEGLPHPVLGVIALFLPSAVLLADLIRSIRARQKSRAIGMAIYAGVGALLFGPLFAGTAIVLVVCGGSSV